MPVQSGDQVGAYRIVQQLGQGGMASVYKAYHPELDRFVAIKFMHQSFQEDPNFIARFEREARIIARLDHPNIVPVYDFSNNQGQPYLVMKYIEGQTLRHVLAVDGYPVIQLLAMIRAVAAGLSYAHQQGVLHRDIKPANILIDNENRPYLSDFGLARLAQVGSSTLSQDMLLGTPHYMSPEQARGQQELTPATDIYSLGVILYEIAVGQVPFSGNTPYAIVHDHIYTPLPSPSAQNPAVNAAVETVLLKALAKDPEQRYGSALEMAEAFEKATLSGTKDSSPDVSATSSRVMDATTPDAANVSGVGQAVRKTQPNSPTARQAPASPVAAAKPNRSGLFVLVAAIIIVVVGLVVLSGRNRGNRGDETLPTLASIEQADMPTTATITDTPIPTAADSASATGVASQQTIIPLDVPVLTIQEAQAGISENPNAEVNYLSLAQAHWANDDIPSAQDAITEGFRFADDPITYLLTAAAIADENRAVDSAILLYTQALYLAEGDESRYPGVRAIAGEYLYDAALTAPASAFEVARRAMGNQAGFGRPDFADIISARVLVSSNRYRLADAALRRLPVSEVNSPEARLVNGELLSAEGRPGEARAEWEAILGMADAPQWVKDRATTLLSQ